MSIGRLRKIIREHLSEGGGGFSLKKQPQQRNSMSPDIANREELGANTRKDLEPDQITDHLSEPLVDKEDVYGPVPPRAENPYVQQDPYVKDYSPLPTPPIKR